MQRVVVVGRGASGKSTFARRLGQITGIPVVELDSHFWGADLAGLRHEQWITLQRELIGSDRWIMDGDLGPDDALDIRVKAADTVIMLDFSLIRCTWRAARRSRERVDFWMWLVTYRHRWRPVVIATIATHAPSADLHILRRPGDVDRFLDERGR